MTTKYLTTAETAALVRGALKGASPGTKFSVRSYVYAGGSSIRVRYDGITPGAPTTAEVKKVVGRFEGAGFDGMIDLKYPVTAYVKDGKVVGTKSPGGYPTTPGWDDAVPGATEVHFGADYIFVEGRAA